MTEPDPIRRYLDENGATYTPEAIRTKLLEAGYAEADVDAAIGEWKAARSGSEADQRAFRKWAIWFHLGALAAMVVVVLLLKGTDNSGYVLLAAGILALSLGIGYWLSSLIGRALLPKTGMTVALFLPLASAVVLAGSCIGLMNATISDPPLAGTMSLEVTAPDSFSGSAAANCYTSNDGSISTVVSESLGEVEGLTVTVLVNPAADGGAFYLVVELTDEQPENYRSYSITDQTEYHVDMADAGVSGQVSFSNLTAEVSTNTAGEVFEPLSGEVSWTCEAN